MTFNIEEAFNRLESSVNYLLDKVRSLKAEARERERLQVQRNNTTYYQNEKRKRFEPR